MSADTLCWQISRSPTLIGRLSFTLPCLVRKCGKCRKANSGAPLTSTIIALLQQLMKPRITRIGRDGALRRPDAAARRPYPQIQMGRLINFKHASLRWKRIINSGAEPGDDVAL
jgi:hypothetical protein